MRTDLFAYLLCSKASTLRWKGGDVREEKMCVVGGLTLHRVRMLVPPHPLLRLPIVSSAAGKAKPAEIGESSQRAVQTGVRTKLAHSIALTLLAVRLCPQKLHGLCLSHYRDGALGRERWQRQGRARTMWPACMLKDRRRISAGHSKVSHQALPISHTRLPGTVAA